MYETALPLLFVLSPALQPDRGAALERKLRRSLLRREPVSLGTSAAPYAPAGSRSSLSLLLAAEGLEISILTDSPLIGREVALLAELDRKHSVAVQMIVPLGEIVDPEPRMQAIRILAAEGIATSLLLQAVAPATKRGEESLRFFLEEARAAGAGDVQLAAGSLPRRQRAPLLAAFQRQRLAHGFPRPTAGRA